MVILWKSEEYDKGTHDAPNIYILYGVFNHGLENYEGLIKI